VKAKAIFFHAGCPVCVAAEDNVAKAIDTSKYDVEIVHLGNNKSRIAEAESAGIKSVPALLLDGTPFHINFGASLADLKGGA
jgi:predicted DsbA family dithiol-disulfide isomerase